MDFRQLSSDAGEPVAKHVLQILESVENPMWRFVENQRRGKGTKSFKLFPTCRLLRRKESGEMEFVRRQAGSSQRCNRGACPRDRDHFHIVFATIADNAIPRIRNSWRSCIRNQCNVQSFLDLLRQGSRFRLLIEIVVTREWLLNSIVVEQLDRLASILTRDEVCSRQGLECTRTNVREITDWSCDNEKSAHI